MIRSESLASCRSTGGLTLAGRVGALAMTFALVSVGAVALAAAPAFADGGVLFTDIAENGGAGITYERAPSARLANLEAVQALAEIPFSEFRDVRANETPMKPHGAPGVALFDFDRDGDVDIYATNGPGAPNSLYSNQLVESGSVTFVDVAAAAGVEATAQDSAGVCYGDLDNDGDDDLYVLGTGEPNRLFENQLADTGVATFVDVTSESDTGGGSNHAAGCSMADFNGDGLLDVVVANTYDDWTHRKPIFINEVYSGLEHNQLFTNLGSMEFVDTAADAGLHQLLNLPAGGYSWAISAVDYDLDGDADIVVADTQGAAATSPAEERGYNRLFENDGTGHFTELTYAANLRFTGSWMGLSWGDFNCDGNLDFFSTNLGDYLSFGAAPSAVFLADGFGGFEDPSQGGVGGTAFGWGTVATDYDNDGDTDIIYHGGIEVMTVGVADNPGAILQNQGCGGTFAYDLAAPTRDHRPRQVQGFATADLNRDGFADLVSIADSIFDVNNPTWLPWVGVLSGPHGSDLDSGAHFLGIWVGASGQITFLNPTIFNGDLSVEINSGDNGNASVTFDTVGGVDLVDDGGVNRNGIGAVLSFTPYCGNTSMHPVVGGASYASQDELAAIFGLGAAAGGDLEVLWPGGVRNRLYDVVAGERVTVPEIPCSYDGPWKNYGQYNSCVMQALTSYLGAGTISAHELGRLRDSAERAYHEAH